jgi:hypothetical protein
MPWNPFKLFARRYTKPIERRVRNFSDELDNIRSRLDFDERVVDRYFAEKLLDPYNAVFEAREPLVTVCIATYNRGKLLTERAIPSILNQTYKNLELIVIGDCCTDDTATRIAQIADPRLTFVNLPTRGVYPSSPELRWMVAGTVPINHALSLANGHFITHLDDDDEHTADRLEKLVSYALKEKAELVWHPFYSEDQKGRWQLENAERFQVNQVTTSSVLYHHWFRNVSWDLNAWRFREPGDWNRFRKFKYLGAKCLRYPEPLLRHYRERSQNKNN